MSNTITITVHDYKHTLRKCDTSKSDGEVWWSLFNGSDEHIATVFQMGQQDFIASAKDSEDYLDSSGSTVEDAATRWLKDRI